MNAADLVPVRPEGNIRFGLGRLEMLAADLRALADAIDAGRVGVGHIETTAEAARDDFPWSTVMLRYCEFKTGTEADHG